MLYSFAKKDHAMKPVTIGGQIFYREKLDTYTYKKSFDKIEKIEYSIRRELATECVSMGVDAEERVRKRDSA